MKLKLPQSVALLGARRGEILPSGAYFATQGSSTFFDPIDPKVALYDLGGVRVADTSDQEVAIAVLSRALDVQALTDGDRRRLVEAFDEARAGEPFIDYFLADELPLAEAAQELGYGGLRVWENDDQAAPSSVFIWKLDSVRELSLAESAQVRAYFAMEQGILMESPKDIKGMLLVDGKPVVVQTSRDEDGLTAHGASIPEDQMQMLIASHGHVRALNQLNEVIELSFDMDGQTLVVVDAVADVVTQKLGRMETLKGHLASRNQDPKYLEQILGRMAAEGIKSLEDKEIDRVFANVVLSDYCIQYAKTARECGLTLRDVYEEENAPVAPLQLMSLPDDYRSHHGDWVRACEIAKEAATNDADRTYWEHQLNTLSKIQEDVTRLYGHEISGVDGLRLLPGDYGTHHGDWSKACQIALDASLDDADKSYWGHQLDVLSKALGERTMGLIRTGLSVMEPAPESSYVVLKIEETGNAAFVEVGRDHEIARILDEAAQSIEVRSSIDDGFLLSDLNGNRVGQVERVSELPKGELSPGAVRLDMDISYAAFDDDNGGVAEIASILRKAAQKVRDGAHDFALHDINGNRVGAYEYQELPSLAKDGVIDMREALESGRVYLAEGGYTGIAEDEYRFVVTTPDFEPGYHQDSGEVWLVNAKGEIADGYEEPQEVRETMFSELKGDQKKDLREVAEGRMSAEDFERRYGDDNDLDLN